MKFSGEMSTVPNRKSINGSAALCIHICNILCVLSVVCSLRKPNKFGICIFNLMYISVKSKFNKWNYCFYSLLCFSNKYRGEYMQRECKLPSSQHSLQLREVRERSGWEPGNKEVDVEPDTTWTCRRRLDVCVLSPCSFLLSRPPDRPSDRMSSGYVIYCIRVSVVCRRATVCICDRLSMCGALGIESASERTVNTSSCWAIKL